MLYDYRAYIQALYSFCFIMNAIELPATQLSNRVGIPIVYLRQLKQQLRNDDYLRQSILKSLTPGYSGKVLLTENVILSRPTTTKLQLHIFFVTIYYFLLHQNYFFLFQNNIRLELVQQILF